MKKTLEIPLVDAQTCEWGNRFARLTDSVTDLYAVTGTCGIPTKPDGTLFEFWRVQLDIRCPRIELTGRPTGFSKMSVVLLDLKEAVMAGTAPAMPQPGISWADTVLDYFRREIKGLDAILPYLRYTPFYADMCTWINENRKIARQKLGFQVNRVAIRRVEDN
jgi:hypothetical protein